MQQWICCCATNSMTLITKEKGHLSFNIAFQTFAMAFSKNRTLSESVSLHLAEKQCDINNFSLRFSYTTQM